MDSSKCVPIDSKNPDYRQWGKNCKIMGMTAIRAQSVLDSFYGENHVYTSTEYSEFWHGFNGTSAVTDDMRKAVFADIKERLALPSSDEARIGAEEMVYDLAELAGLIPPRLTEKQKLLLEEIQRIDSSVKEMEFREWYKSADEYEQPITAAEFFDWQKYKIDNQ